MNKMMMAVAGLAMAVAITGCGGSPKSVAEDFVNAVIQRETDKAMKCYNVNNATSKQIKDMKEELENVGKEINDNKLEAEATYEEIDVPAENDGYKLINGAKITGEAATVRVQFKKGKDKKSEGMEVKLMKIDGTWNVISYSMLRDLDTSDK